MKGVFLGASLVVATLLYGQEFKLGSKVGNFTLNDLKGNAVDYAGLKGNTTLVVFMSTQCPVSNGYNQRMEQLYNDYASKGVHFIFINANFNEPAPEVDQHARTHGLTFPIYKDAGNAAADLFGAQVTPETFLIDSTSTIRYHGYIDDSLTAEHVQNQGLRKALDAVLAAQPVPKAETKAFGCTIKRKNRTS